MKIIFITVFIFCFPIIWLTEISRKEIRVDCRMLMANWHPDVPKEILEKCKGK
jgi:hypothetical protein